MPPLSYRVAVVKWGNHDAIAAAISDELIKLGHEPIGFKFNQPVPVDVDIVFSFAPYGRLMQIPHQLAQLPAEERPLFLHWNTENYPNPRIPWPIVRSIAAFRSWVDRLHDAEANWKHSLIQTFPFSWIDKRLVRFRLIGENFYAYQKGWLDLFFKSSRIYAKERNRRGLPAIFVPWGTVPTWHKTLHLERDIDVLWMGKRRTKRRSELLDLIDNKLSDRGFNVYIADNVVKPFVYGEERTRVLNRAKITLNIESEWYDNALPYRFHVVAPNRSLVVSETLLPHYPAEPGIHYVSTSYENMVETLIHYLEHDDERLEIVENAYQLTTTKHTLENAIKTILEYVSRVQDAPARQAV